LDDLKNKVEKLEAENRHLKVAVAELSILNEIATAVRSTQSLDRIIDLIIHKCVKHLHVEQGVVLLLDKNKEADTFKTMVREIDQSSQFLPYRMDSQLLGWMIKNKNPLLINDYQNDNRIASISDEKYSITSILAVPLISREQLIGLLAMFNKKDLGEFNINDQRLLSIIATQSAQVIENARLFEEERDLIRIREEMHFASDIQFKLLPDRAPEIQGYDIAGKSIPAKEVGGDYFDFMTLSDSRLAFCLGDVSGKGLPAAMLMANLQATLRGQAMFNDQPSRCIYYSNTLLFNSTSSEKFATLFYGILDSAKNTLLFTNAGHDRPFLFSAEKGMERLKTGGIVLGFMENFEYDEDSFTMKPGDVLVIYSDGLSEAMNEHEEEFSEENLEQLIKKHCDLTAADLIDKIISEIQIHVDKTPQMDDMTIIVLKRNSDL